MTAAAAEPLATQASDAARPGNALRLRQVCSRAVPMALGFMPIGYAFAALAHLGGMPQAAVLLMSATVYACSSQIIAAELWAQGQSVGAIVATCVVVNLRHILMSSVIAPYVRRLKAAGWALFSFLLCDEAFALHVAASQQGGMTHREIFVSNWLLYGGWMAGNALAFVLPLTVEQLRTAGLDFAPMGMFIGLLALLVRGPGQLALAAGCAALCLGLRLAGLGAISIVVTAVVGATIAWGVQSWWTARS